MPMRLFRNSIFSIGQRLRFLIGFAIFGAMIFVPVYLQIVDGMSPTRSGLAMLPMVAGLFSSSIPAGRLMSRNGRYKIFPIPGRTMVAGALLLLSQLDADIALLVRRPRHVRHGPRPRPHHAGAVARRAELRRPPRHRRRHQLGDFFRQMGGAFGTALFGAILSSRLAAHGRRDPRRRRGRQRRQGRRVANNVQLIKALPEPVHGLVTGAFAGSLHDMFLTASRRDGGVRSALFLKEKPLAQRDAAAPEAAEQEPARLPIARPASPDRARGRVPLGAGGVGQVSTTASPPPRTVRRPEHRRCRPPGRRPRSRR